MEPSNFEHSNGVADTPKDTDPDRIRPLFVHRVTYPDCGPVLISCWKPTTAELAEIVRTGRVWLTVLGQRMPPVALTGISPFADAARRGAV